MHEMGIALQIVEIATASIPVDLGNVHVERVNLKIGKLAAVVPESLRFCFQIAAQDTPLRNAELIIEEIQIVITCKACQNQWAITEPVFQCYHCNSNSIEIISGRELEISSIEIVDEDAQNDNSNV
jgi:hydrogenase nickel incorporation protein HypA/HybF